LPGTRAGGRGSRQSTPLGIQLWLALRILPEPQRDGKRSPKRQLSSLRAHPPTLPFNVLVVLLCVLFQLQNPTKSGQKAHCKHTRKFPNRLIYLTIEGFRVICHNGVIRLSRRRHGFDPRWDCQTKSRSYRIILTFSCCGILFPRIAF